ncbi:MAG: hydroxyacylglutathione hydrolase [Deltaproteobacteria bacterium]|nr:hydroxyacylglutathione hydrolase [Deltaproteobacteria bacterium]
MLKVEQFRYGADNLGYLVYGPESAVAIDGGAGEEILAFLKTHRLTLLYVTNTHDHGDHTCGNEALLAASGARLLSGAELSDGAALTLDGSKIQVIHTPGHTGDSRVFYTGGALIAGDTLFNGTIGNCFSGDLEGFYRSIRKLMALPDATVVYAGHDYVRDSMAFARHLEPENAEIGVFLAEYDPNRVFSTLAQEKRINPYFRFNEPGIVALLAKRGLPRETEWERWRSLMGIE